MDIQEKSGSTSPTSNCDPNNQMYLDARISSLNGPQLKETGLSAYENAIKVRKPYTITKQRERWTEEEHEKFFEALKLYGRAWRQIEEHIGTKTAVQIRSHAQKYFSKVARESGTAKAIEIPPPRPKRKPMHPYPRKLGHSSSMRMPVLEQPEWSPLPIPSISEQDNRSPTSVLTAFGSDTMGSSVSNLLSSCTSPVSSVAGSNQVGTSDRENGFQLPRKSIEEENRSPSPDPASTRLTAPEKSAMELNLGGEGYVPLKEDSSLEAHATSLKLFGRTVLVTDSQKLSSSSDGSSVQCPKALRTTDIQSCDRSTDMDMQTQAQPVPQNSAGGDFWGTPGKSAWGPWPSGMPPMFFCLPPNGDPVNAAAGATVVPLPWWWAFCGSLPSPFINPQDTSSKQDPCQSCVEATGDKDVQPEGSWSGSNTASAGDVVDSQNAGRMMESAPSSILRPSVNSAFSRLKASSAKPARGFVPYKRCVTEKAVHHSLMADEDGESQGIRLCL